MCNSNYLSLLREVHLAADVFGICLQHAFTTEKQEIMGLLIGEVDEESGISNISACMILHRSDKQPDRVEISPEQLCTASAHADHLKDKLKRPMRVLGWYHSHPHITVWPSHVDVRTQAMYQMMDPHFIGLIFSVFQSDAGSIGNKVQVTCFQASGRGQNFKQREVKLIIVDSRLEQYNLKGITCLPEILVQEEMELHKDDAEGSSPLVSLLNDASRTQALVSIVSEIGIPLLKDFEDRLLSTNRRMKELEAIKKKLLLDR